MPMLMQDRVYPILQVFNVDETQARRGFQQSKTEGALFCMDQTDIVRELLTHHDTDPIQKMTVLGKVASLKPIRNKDNGRSYRLAPHIIFGKAPKATAGRPTKRRQPQP